MTKFHRNREGRSAIRSIEYTSMRRTDCWPGCCCCGGCHNTPSSIVAVFAVANAVPATDVVSRQRRFCEFTIPIPFPCCRKVIHFKKVAGQSIDWQ